MSLPEQQYSYGLPLTLGHEGVGTVAELGEGVTDFEVGDAVAVYGPRGCGHCRTCATARRTTARSRPAGVPLGGLDPVPSVALTDAGLTPYHAIKPSLPKLVPGSTAVVIGTGGLGHVGIQIRRNVSAATVVALDRSEEKLALAKDVGAHHTLRSDDSAVQAVRDLTGGRGADLSLRVDFVGAQPTADLAAQLVRPLSDIVVVGVGRGTVPVGMFALPDETSVRAPCWGTRSEPFEVLDLARTGRIHVETEVFSLSEAPEAHRRLHEGTLRGRAVVVPVTR